MQLSKSYKKIGAIFFALFSAAFLFVGSANAAAVSCPVTDGGAGDGDSTVNGTIQISANTTWSATTGYAADGDYWDCTGVDILVTSNSTLTLEGDTSNGYRPYLKTDNLQIDSGSSISADAQGCSAVSNSGGYGPNPTTNVCTYNDYGAGSGAEGGSGGSHAGQRGAGSTLGPRNPYGDVIAPILFGASGGRMTSASNAGGSGGGVIRIELTGTLTHNGELTARPTSPGLMISIL